MLIIDSNVADLLPFDTKQNHASNVYWVYQMKKSLNNKIVMDFCWIAAFDEMLLVVDMCNNISIGYYCC